MRKKERGQVLAGVIVVLVLLLIIVPAMVTWVQQDSRQAVKDQKTTVAFNLAEAGIDRGMWKLKSATSTWVAARDGIVITGYNFDSTYDDVPGGTYRIRFSTGPASDQVTITAEGRDSQAKETRAIQVVYENQSLPGPILASGSLTYSGAFETHWGPVLAQNNIVVSGNAETEHFPRKYSKQVVSGGAGANARDTNGLNPPNTDNMEWWSDYPVPDLPQLDFVTLRASATANGTLNYYNGTISSHTYTGYPAGTHYCRIAGTSANHPAPHNQHFADSNHHPKSKDNLIWYWDGDLYLTGGSNLSGHSIGIKGTLIVRGNFTIETEDNYGPVVTVPQNAWEEYARIGVSSYDTATLNQYPADDGYQRVRAIFDLGNESWTGGPPSAFTDVGLSGFVYVGGNLTIVANAMSDYHGVIWVVGNIVNNNVGERSLVFYDGTLGKDLPVLNVILTRESWKEVAPSTAAWL
ncbi:MAG: hypothetical protein A3J74_09260 [Elusimicrobia bacterium RIFCSPHIGHO2_02_FULL_57_9]|nr:MAG: hypothetical protein A3J74_09260 [Elusimicrobia bacterium RIFCSPHIGHO2_02_FULL_57_9]